MPEKQLYKGKLLSLKLKNVSLPNGHQAALEVVKHPGAALTVPFVSKNKIILLRQFRPVIETYLYELPAGTLKKGERPLDCARREIKEETGYSASRFTYLGAIFPVPGYSTEQIHLYRAEGLKRCRGYSCDNDECIESAIVDRPGIKKLFNQRKIQDAKTICALALCGWV